MTASRLLIVGPQGSGKGTQGVRVAEAFGIPIHDDSLRRKLRR